MIIRTEYLDLLKRFKDKDLIKVITGVKRCGKSTLFELFIDYLKESNIKANRIIQINLENPEYQFKDYMDLYNYVNKQIKAEKKYYVFLDEVQNVPEFQKAVDGLYIKKNVDLYITSTVVYKDITARNNITDKMLLENVIKFIYDSIGSPISTKKISDTLTSKGIATSNHTVENYITAFLESYLIYKADRFDVKGEKLLSRDYKYYAVDTGLRSYLLGKKANSDMGHLLENIVYLELLRRGYKVYVGKVADLEIDFVAENRNGLEYYQVSLSTRDDKVLERELKVLERTGDHYPKCLLTLDIDLETDYNGIVKKNVVDWLLGR